MELKYFGGLSEEEVAAVLSLSRATITREWQSARAWLYRRVTAGRAGAIMSDVASRWPRVKEIFHAALARPDRIGARRSCATRAATTSRSRDEVESLLAAHAAAGSFAEQPAIDGGALDASQRLAERRRWRTDSSSDRIESSGRSTPAAWARCIVRSTRDSIVKWPSRCCRRRCLDDPERVARLEREARLLAALNHPHIATIHGLEITGGVHAIVMELIDGPTLADRLSSGPLPLDVALDIARQIAEALEAAHEKGIIHRDLKPANIKLTADRHGEGARLRPREGHASDEDKVAVTLTTDGAGSREGLVAGTPGYMSPEQVRGERVDARSDIWAFGCVVYEMLTAHQAFGGATSAGTSAAIPESEPDWDRLPPTVPVGIRRMLRRCLERDPGGASITSPTHASRSRRHDDPDAEGRRAARSDESAARSRARRLRPRCWRWRWLPWRPRGSCAGR